MPTNGDFLTCMSEVEEDLASEDPAATKRAMRKIGTHIVRMHQQLDEMIQAHTDENGQPYNIHAAYNTLEGISVEMKDMRKLLWTAQIGVYVFGAIAPIIIGIAVYEFNQLRKSDEETVRINMEQTIMLERIQAVQQGIIEHLNIMKGH